MGRASHHAIILLIRDLYLIDPGSAGTIAAAEYGSASVITLLPVLIGLNLAVILLAIASTRARLTRGWVIVIAVVAFAANFFLPAGGTELFAILVATEFAMIAHGQGRTAVNPA